MDTEADLQKLLAENSPTSPRHWLLIKREVGIPNREGGGAGRQWITLAMDQDSVAKARSLQLRPPEDHGRN